MQISKYNNNCVTKMADCASDCCDVYSMKEDYTSGSNKNNPQTSAQGNTDNNHKTPCGPCNNDKSYMDLVIGLGGLGLGYWLGFKK